MEVTNQMMEEAWNNRDNRLILHRASAGFAKSISPDDIESLQMEALWKALRKFNPNAGMKFTSFLYLTLRFLLLNNLRKRKNKLKFTSLHYEDGFHDVEDKSINDILFGMSQDDQEILYDRFYLSKSYKDISKENNISEGQVKKRIKKALRNV